MDSTNKTVSLPSGLIELPLLPLRDVVVYPHMVIPLFVGREKSIRALEQAMTVNKQILLVAQKNASDDDPKLEDIYRIGTISTVLQLLKLPDGTVKVLVEGGVRATSKIFVLMVNVFVHRQSPFPQPVCSVAKAMCWCKPWCVSLNST